MSRSASTERPPNSLQSHCVLGAGAKAEEPRFTVQEASCLLHDESIRPGFFEKPISITGYVIATNLPDAPKCAVHGPKEFDPEDCYPPVPLFWLGNTRNATREGSIQVVGWASGFAQVVGAIDQYSTAGASSTYVDVYWGKPIPNPIPAVGAWVTVVGIYGVTTNFPMRGVDTNAGMGILTYSNMTTAQPSQSPAVLPRY